MPKKNKTGAYDSWIEMRRRCRRKNHPCQKSYAAFGITVCERWQVYDKFIADMGEKPTSCHTLERINNDRGYEPSNCRWATKAEQNRNRRFCRYFTIDGVTKCLAEWVREHGACYRTAAERLQRGDNILQALKRVSTRFITRGKESMTLAGWCKKLDQKYGTVVARIRRGWTTERALETRKEDGN